MPGLRFAAAAALIVAGIFPCVHARPQAPAATSRAPAATLVEDLVYANHILYDQGVVDGFGHVSARSDKDPSRFLLSRSTAPALVTSADILEFDLNGEPVDAHGSAVFLERYIHAAIYRARPDVKAIVHSHSPAVIPFGITGTTLRPVYHVSSFLGAGAPIFEIREAGGATDMLIRDNKLADALAKTLGDHAVVLMRGHGFVAAGDSVPQAVFRAIYTEVNARIQAEASRLGPVNFLTPEEAAKAAATLETQMPRAWELWKAHAGKIE
jgi:HCOMODA/2-hydroxy-3-carboxy-muconic semialdehyde decarboxylase